MKALRSVLYSPGNKPKLIEKGPSTGADALCIVLEDSVPDDLKTEAREIVKEEVGKLAALGQTMFVKVNEIDSGYLEADLPAIVQPGLAGIFMPKLQTAEEVCRVDQMLTAAEAANRVPAGQIEMVLLLETPLAVLKAFDLITASRRVASIIGGGGGAEGGDLNRGMGYVWTPEGFERLFMRSKGILDARAAGLENPFEGVYSDINDLDGLGREALIGRQLGYRGRLALHPKQVETINQVFMPTAKEVDWQRRVLEAFDKALAEGSASFVLEGKFIDYAMVATAKKVIALADAVGVRTGD